MCTQYCVVSCFYFFVVVVFCCFRQLSSLILFFVVSYLQSNWIGGFKHDGAEVRGFDTLKKVLGVHFDLVEDFDLAYVIRETVREHQWTVSHMTIWKRK